ncbi:unnamed protein product, partial [Mesorhabditis spiculigera]
MKVKETLCTIVANTPGVQNVWLTDKDGVPIVGTGEDHRVRTAVIEAHVGAFEQIQKLETGSHRSSIYYFEHSQIIILQQPPVVIYIVADGDANTGFVLRLREKLDPIITEIRQLFPQLPVL